MTVDVHGHLTSPELLAKYPMPPVLGDLPRMLDAKRAAGITITVVGSPVGAGTMIPRPGVDNFDQPASDLERYHDWLADQVREHPDELRAYAFVNPFGSDRDLALLAARLEQPEFVGVIVNSSVNGRLLGDPDLNGFWAFLAERGLPVLVHPPAEPVGTAAVPDLGLLESVARPHDVALSLASLVLAGVLDRHPGLVIIAAGTGSGLAGLAFKLDAAAANPRPNPLFRGRAPDRPQVRPSAELRRLHVDTGNSDPVAVGAALAFFGPDRVCFGSDSPPMAEPLGRVVDRVGAAAGSARHAVLEANADRILGLRAPVWEVAL